MVKSELYQWVANKVSALAPKDVEDAIKEIIEHLANALGNGMRIEIRGFGSFKLHYHPPRKNARNPKTGEQVVISTGKYTPHFKPGKELRERVNKGFGQLIKGGSKRSQI